MDPRVELRLGGVWTDVTGFVYQRDPISITRGRSDEAGKTDPGRCSLTVNNRDGRFSPRNPRGPYFGSIGRNTPIRVYVRHGDRALFSPGVEDRDRVTTPDSAQLSVTGDIDIRIDATARHWAATGLASKYEFQGDQRSWAFYVQPGGELAFAWSTDGTVGNRTVVESTEPIVTSAGRQALRVTLDVSVQVITFYTAPTIDGPWTQLDVVDNFGATSIFDGTAELEVGHLEDIGGFLPISGRIHAFELRNGINGPLVADPVFAAQVEGARSFTDGQGNTWTLQGETEITDKRYRFHGEVSEWPQRWDTSDSDVYAQVEAAGILRRLAAGAVPLQSALRRELTSPDAANLPVAYWPCEDGRRAEEIASALDSGRPMTITGTPDLAADNTFVCSEPLPTMGSAIFKGRAPRYDVTGQTQVRLLLAVPDSGAGDTEKIVTIDTTGSVQRWDLQYSTIGGGGGLHLLGFDENNTQVANSNAADFGLDGHPARVSLEFTQNGPDIDFDVAVLKVGSFARLVLNSTAAGHTFGRINRVSVNPGRNLGDVTVGHVSVHNEITDIFTLDSLDGFTGEPPGERMQRLADEEGIPLEIIGNPEGAPWLGPQLPVTLVDLFHEAAESDSGMLFEPRGQLGIGLRTHDSLYNQVPVVSLDYAAAQVAGAIEPVDDDQATRNDVTVSRQGGSSSRIIQTDGPLSIHRPPAGVGRYNTDVTVSAHHGEFLPHMAGWRVRLGTVDEARYPRITADFVTPGISSDPALVEALLFLDVGDRLTIVNPPPWLPPEPISQIVQGYTETFDESPQHTMTFNCSPESPQRVAEVDETGNTASRYGAPSALAPVVEDFEDNDFNVELSGTWARTSATANTGSWSLKAATITHNETTDAVIQVPAGYKTLAFAYKVSSEAGFDLLRVLVDGVEVAAFSGEVDWFEHAPINIAGARQVTFQYQKDGSVSSGQDTAWIDDVTFGGTGSRLDSDVSDSATSLSVATNSEPLWVTGLLQPAEFPLDIMVGGERMTVTNIADTTSPQAFFVTRSINGVTKSHAAGTPVELFAPAYRAL